MGPFRSRLDYTASFAAMYPVRRKTMTENLTLAEWIDRGPHSLPLRADYGHGTDNALDEAAWLVLHAAGAALDGSFADWGRVADEATAGKIERLSRLRCETGKPLAYLRATPCLPGWNFEVNEHVLVPRSPLAELILDRFPSLGRAGQGRSGFSICAPAAAVLRLRRPSRLPGPRVDAADISVAALEVAQQERSAARSGDRVALFESDLFRPFRRRLTTWSWPTPLMCRRVDRRLPGEYRAEPGLGPGLR